MDNYVVDKLQQASGPIFYPETLIEAIKLSAKNTSVSLKDILTLNGFPLDYELYSFKINLAVQGPRFRVVYFDQAEGRKPAHWDYANGYFDWGDWAHAFFVRDSFPCMVKYDGTIDYKLDPQNYALKEDGSKSDITNTDYEGSAMVAFPTIWIKRWSDDNYLYVSICNKQLDEDFHAYMHTDKNGKVCKYKYVGIYFSTLFTDRYKSLARQTYTVNETFANQLLHTHTNGDNWEMFSWSDFATIGDLLTLLSKSDDSQTAFGYGRCNVSSRPTSDGGCYTVGSFYNSAALNTNSTVKIFYLLDLYDTAYTRMAGLIYLNGKLFVKPYPEYNATAQGYENLDITITGTSDTFIKKTAVNQYGRFPVELGGSATLYECDSVIYANNVTGIARTRGVYNATTKAGKLALYLSGTEAADANTASRLTCFSAD